MINNDGLISTESDAAAGNTMVKTVTPADKTPGLERLQDGFNKLVEQLQGINNHLDQQILQHEDLINRIDKMPRLLESFPAVVENQKQIVDQLFEQLKATATKYQQFTETVEKIPAETVRQTHTLVNINHQLAAAAEADVQMTEGFNKFCETLDKLNQNVTGQINSIAQMNKTFAASDRHLKYIVSVQNRRFMWLAIITTGVCTAVILIMTWIIIYLVR